MKKIKYIKLKGILSSDNQFSCKYGWETTTIAQAARNLNLPKTDYKIELIDDKGAVLSISIPLIKSQCSRANNDKPRKLEAHIQYDNRAAKIRLKLKDKVIFEKEISKKPPSVKIEKVSITKNFVNVTWTVTANEATKVLYNIGCIKDDSEIYTFTSNYQKNHAKLPRSNFPKASNIKIVVLASDGFRSHYDISKPINLKNTNNLNELVIQKPYEGESFPYGQPISYLGCEFNRFEGKITNKSITWFLNGKKINENKESGILRDIKPGKYKLIMKVKTGKKTLEKDINFEVNQMNKQQERYNNALKRIDLLR